MNFSNDYDYYEEVEDYTYNKIPPYVYVLTVTIVHSCICAVGYVGNIIICIVIVSNKPMHTTTNTYLFNLAIADLTMLSSGLAKFTIANWYPFHIYRLYGRNGCFVLSWISNTAVNVSIMTITAFTIERYLAICHPFLARMMSSISKAVKVIFLIWIIGIIYGYLIGSQQKLKFLGNESVCIHDKTIPYSVEVESVIFFFLPFTLIAVLYILIGKKVLDSTKIQKNQGSSNIANGRSEMQNDEGNSNKQIFKMLVTVVVVFFVCWAPYYIRRLFWLHGKHLLPNSFLDEIDKIEFVLTEVFFISYFLSSAINPIIYSVMSNKFRDAFKELFKCRQKQTKKTIQVNITATTAV